MFLIRPNVAQDSRRREALLDGAGEKPLFLLGTLRPKQTKTALDASKETCYRLCSCEKVLALIGQFCTQLETLQMQ